MGLFNRRTKPADANTTAAIGNERHNRRSIMSTKERKYDSNHTLYSEHTLNKRPSFGQWIKVTWPDILTMVVMGIIGLGVSKIWWW